MNHLHAIRYFEQVLSVKFWSICQIYINFFVFLIRSPTRQKKKKTDYICKVSWRTLRNCKIGKVCYFFQSIPVQCKKTSWFMDAYTQQSIICAFMPTFFVGKPQSLSNGKTSMAWPKKKPHWSFQMLFRFVFRIFDRFFFWDNFHFLFRWRRIRTSISSLLLLPGIRHTWCYSSCGKMRYLNR